MRTPRTKMEMEKLAEANKDEVTRSMLKGADPTNVNALKNAYYGISDNMIEFVRQLNWINHHTGEFGVDLAFAKKMQKMFDRMTLGKFL
ncbi:MAG: hypothetical protein DRP51_10105 [Candidatus Zixiibacteriota bacterium]|nr:MAG: hypothetical protein DRP51_10105 [candidate division Zixibacteria bacterium]